MKRLLVCLSLAGLVGLGGQAFAVIGTIDDVPGATLLLPKFIVELDADGIPVANGLTTLFSINNASAAPALVHVTLWTNKSVPTLDFPIWLTGYDVQTINVRDIFNGVVPQTGTAALSPTGAFSLAGSPPASCGSFFPVGAVPPILVDFIRRVHRGLSSPLPNDGLCYANLTDLAEGYITIDNVTQCTQQTPDQCDAGYQPILSNVNQLWGDYFYVDVVNNFAQGETLVHIEADESLDVTDYTFYRRYCQVASDQREGLASTFAVRYVDGGVFTGGTTLKVWRDSKTVVQPRVCGTGFGPHGFPLGQTQIVIFDEQENPFLVPDSPFSPPIDQEALLPFPWEVNNTLVGGPTLPVPFPFGWLYLNLNTTVANQTVPFGPAMQNWVTAVMDADGRFSVGFDAIQLDNVTFDGPTLVTAPGRSNCVIGLAGSVICL